MRALRQRGRRPQAGLSLVELMVGITVGLIVVAAASLLIGGQLAENRRLIAETQLQQDLRATADIIARELRRTGSAGRDADVQLHVWTLGSARDATPNWHGATLTPNAGTASEVRFGYLPSGASSMAPGGFGFRLVPAQGQIQTFLTANGWWNDLTDRGTIDVTAFSVTRLPDVSYRIPCAKPCPVTGDSACWPTVNMRSFEISITARSRAVPEVVRTVTSRVRARNEQVRYFATTPQNTGDVCPP